MQLSHRMKEALDARLRHRQQLESKARALAFLSTSYATLDEMTTDKEATFGVLKEENFSIEVWTSALVRCVYLMRSLRGAYDCMC